jgi:phosphate starvation-inducible PhoH-like protein
MSKKTKRKKIKEIEELETALVKSKWEYDFEVTNRYTLNYNQQSLVETMLRDDTFMSIVDGPAGTAKTYLAVYAALKLISQRKLESIVYIRSVVESASKSIGSLPGEIDEKFAPWSMPLNDKLEELVSTTVIKNLHSTNVLRSIPVNFVRGLTFRNCFVIVDEAQNLTLGELTTILTRFGRNTKYVIAGDTSQSDIGKNSGFPSICNKFAGVECEQKGIFNFKFTEDDIVRSEILRFIVSRLQKSG